MDRLSYLSRTNSTPTESEGTRLKGLILEEEDNIRHVDDEIAQVQAALDALMLRLSNHCARLDTYTRITSCIRRLPTEILVKIFLVWHEVQHVNDRPMPNSTPLIISHVCSQWRDIAIDIPELWEDIRIDANRDGAVCLAKLWLSRTKTSLFSITLWTYDLFQTGIIDFLLPYLPNCRSLRMHLPGSVFYYLDLSVIPPGSMRRLEHIAVMISTSIRNGALAPQNPIWEHLSHQFHHAPLLRSAIISSIGSLDMKQIVLPWSQLTSLSLSMSFCPEIFVALRQCQSLELCELYVQHPEDGNLWVPDLSSTTVTYLPYLRRLTALVQDGSIMNHIYQSFTLPALVYLSVSSPWSSEAFLSFQARSRFELKELELAGSTLGLEEIEPILRSISSLRCLNLLSCEFYKPSFLEALQVSSSDDEDAVTLLPKLEDLIVVDRQSEVRDIDVANMVEPRWKKVRADVSQIRYISLPLSDDIPNDDTIRRLNQCLEEGLRVNIFRERGPNGFYDVNMIRL